MDPSEAREKLSLYCPISPELHPRAEEVEARSVEWMTRQGIYPDEQERLRLSRIRVGEFVARIMPSGTEASLQAAADFVMWLFAFDDAFCDEGRFGQRPHGMAVYAGWLGHLLDSPHAEVLPDDPYAQSLRDLRLRMEVHASPVQLRRWSDAVRSYLYSQVWEAANRDDQRVCDVDSYTVLRLYSGAAMVCPTLIDIVNQHEVSTEELARPLVRAAGEVAGTIVVWDNDLISHGKESRRGEDQHNLLSVLMHERGCSMEEATREAVRMRDAVMALFLRLLAQGQSSASLELSMYLKGLGNFVRANIDWSNRSGRYFEREVRSSAEGVVALEMPLVDVTTLEPLPVRSIQWWWGCVSSEG
ncbi:terpene synthase [Myxococcus sp. CA039A]|uniref:terpene synthase family protein n=1 Tax=Myxococcus sp. CA039A TaxID=2741737 RepID=UPI00157B21A5|nr:terpene synthase [Myxococcus sp. CA039A]